MLKVIGVETLTSVEIPGRAVIAHYKDPTKATARAQSETAILRERAAPGHAWAADKARSSTCYALKVEDEGGREILFLLSPVLPVDR